MGRTIPSFRIVAEIERTNWRPFRELLNKKHRKIFDEMFSYARLYNSACMMAARPVVFHSVIMSILFEHYKQLMQLRGKMKKDESQEWTQPETQQMPYTTLDDYGPTKY
jgi:hypothetical protein